jgi:hypothetical protein
MIDKPPANDREITELVNALNAVLSRGAAKAASPSIRTTRSVIV